MNQIAQVNQNSPWYQAIANAKRQFMQIVEAENNQINYQKEALFAVQAIQGNQYLMNIANNNPQSLQDAVINIASIGLSLNPAEKLAYLVPRGDKACLDISYIGLIKLATDTGSIVWAKAELVHSTDKFMLQGVGQVPIHEFNPFSTSRGDIIGGYSVAKLHNGDMLIDTQTEDYFQRCRNVAQTKNVWDNWPEAMRLKTLVKVGSKFWPKSKRLDQAIHLINEHEGADFSRVTKTVSDIPAPRALNQSPAQQPANKKTVQSAPTETEQPSQTLGNIQTLDDGQAHMIRISLEKYSVSEEEFLLYFEIDCVESLPLAKINKALDWIRNYQA